MRELVRAPGHDRNRSLGWFLTAWFEHWCVHGPGDVVGERVEMDDEFAGFVLDAYAVDERGRRLYDSAFMSRAKGRAKSELAGFVTLGEALTRVRFAGWAEGGEVYQDHGFRYVYAKGEPIGRPVTHPVIRCLATEEGQAGNTYDHVLYNLTEGPLAELMHRDSAGATKTSIPGGGEILPSTSGDASKDGGLETFVVFDETHLYTTPKLRSMYDTVRRNLTKRRRAEPWSLETSTMYEQGAESIAEGTHEVARLMREAQQTGKLKNLPQRTLFDHRESDPVEDISDRDQVRAAIREAYGPFADVIDLERKLDEFMDPRNAAASSRRFTFNQADSAADAWVSEVQWRAIGPLSGGKVAAPAAGDTITVGFDGSEGRANGKADATALIGCRVRDGLLFELGVWEQPDGPAGDGWTPPISEIEAAVADAFTRYRVVGMYCDPAARWSSRIDVWEGRYVSRLKVRGHVSGHPMYWWMSGRRGAAVADAIEKLYQAIVERQVRHLGEKALTAHVIHARRRIGQQGVQIHKENPESLRKIDAAVAAVLAFQARSDALARGIQDRPAEVPIRVR